MQLVNILLATYKPNLMFFEKLLCSLNDQTYPNIYLIIRDDSDDELAFGNISNAIEKNILNFNYSIYKNNINLGSNKTFEQLTKDANGEYLTYCDQDDIWEKDKIAKLVENIKKENAVLCYSDLSIMDENDASIAKSFKDINNRLNHMYGENLFSYFLRRNSITGCTMLIRSEIAKKAIPFCHEYYVHDHWLTLFASTQGKIAYVNESLVRYRIHENNQIGASMLVGINSREEYIYNKLLKEQRKYEYLLRDFEFNNAQREQIQNVKDWTDKRRSFFEKRDIKNTCFMIRSLKDDWQLITFELFINFAPGGIVKRVFKKIKA